MSIYFFKPVPSDCGKDHVVVDPLPCTDRVQQTPVQTVAHDDVMKLATNTFTPCKYTMLCQLTGRYSFTDSSCLQQL